LSSREANQHWYVLYTIPRWEKKVSKFLSEKGVEHYCPLNKSTRQWSDRKKVVLEPLFKGYIFVRSNEQEKWHLKDVQGVLNFVYWLGKPAIVRDEEILTVRKFLDEFENVEVIDNQLKEKDTVFINQGLLLNYKGIVLSVFGNKVKVHIASMGLDLIAYFDKNRLSLI
jgi:transcription antitermination factor NusG